MFTERVMLQPGDVCGEMRDYQLAGLNFLIKMHNHGVGAILGDEMVRCPALPFCCLRPLMTCGCRLRV